MSAGTGTAGTIDVDVAPKVISKAAWKKAAFHTITCPSGVVVGIRVPDLAALIEAGQIPQHLLEAALEAAGQTSDVKPPSVEAVVQQREFTDKLTQLTVIEPKLETEDLAEIPFEDKELICAIALRVRDVDALGDHIAGLDKVEKFRRFRGIGEFRPNVEGV